VPFLVSRVASKLRTFQAAVNAVEIFASLLPAESVRRLARIRANRFDELSGDARAREPLELDVEEARRRTRDRWGGDLCGLLNAMTRGELASLAIRIGVGAGAGDYRTTASRRVDKLGDRSPELRVRLWEHGAGLERHGVDVAASVQPRPVLLGGHLVIQAPPRGAFPPSDEWPRRIPPPVLATPPDEEPDSLDELLAAADRVLGVRLGRRGRDKGAWGSRAASLLGVVDRGLDEPDWRGDVEIKTVPIAVDRASGRWRIVEDPAIAMVGELAFAKLQRTLWLARADVGEDDATIVSWYLVDWDPLVARLARRYLHVRPKGPAGSHGRGLYLHKRFFADAGMLATLNGTP